MAVSRKGLKIAAVVVLLGAYGVLQYLAARPQAPAIALKGPPARTPFPFDFTLSDLHANTVRLADFRGQVVLVNFWATWCYPCRTEMPSMEAVYQEYKQRGFTILAISSDIHGSDAVAPFVQESTLTFPVLLDPQNVVGTRLQVRGIPMSYLLDKQGRIAGMELGAKNWYGAKMRQLIDQLLGENS
jgi:cytochrome c biogenesis protein CcmG, thiol:disulfide interchange protein DsbE